MKIMLFGVTGTFGTAMKKICGERNIEFVGLDHTNVDIRDHKRVECLINKIKPDVVVNSVAIIGINLCENEPCKTFDINTVAVSNIARVCQTNGILFVQLSSHAVFDGKKVGAYTEDDLPNPSNIYAVSKYSAELLVQNICDKYYIVRFPTLFGPRNNSSLGFVDKMIEMIQKGNDIVAPYDKIDTLSYTEDIAKMLIDVIKTGEHYGTYHLANSGSVSYYDFCVKLIELLGSSVKVVKVTDDYFPTLGKKSLRTSMKSKYKEPIRSWSEALEEYIETLK